MQNFKTRVTLKDIAAHVGVSMNAASKVLNNTRSSGKVSEETRRRIVEAAKLLGYLPNSAARSLVRQRSDIIGLYIDGLMDTSEPFTASLIDGAERGCRERNQSLLLVSRGPAQSVDDVCFKLLSGIVDGVVIAGWSNPEILQRLIDGGLPMVQYPYGHPKLPSVQVDEASAARQAVECLARAGHKRIYFRTFPTVDYTRGNRYAEAAAEFGLKFSVVPVADGDGNVSDAERALLALPGNERPTAVACWNDAFAYKMVAYCVTAGLGVPNDLAIIGFDGARTFPTPLQRLTTVHVPWSDIAHTAVSLLVDIRDGKEIPQETLLSVTLQSGDTV